MATHTRAQVLTLAAPAMHRECEASDSQSDQGERGVLYGVVHGSRGSRHADCASVVSTAIDLVMGRQTVSRQQDVD